MQLTAMLIIEAYHPGFLQMQATTETTRKMKIESEQAAEAAAKAGKTYRADLGAMLTQIQNMGGAKIAA